MSDDAADRAHVVPPLSALHSDQGASRRGVVVPLRVAFDNDLSDRRMIKTVLVVGAWILFVLAVLGWG